jgi:hypothetical protein
VRRADLAIIVGGVLAFLLGPGLLYDSARAVRQARFLTVIVGERP